MEPTVLLKVTLSDTIKARFLKLAEPYASRFYSGNLNDLIGRVEYSYLTDKSIEQTDLSKLDSIYAYTKRAYKMNGRSLFVKNYQMGLMKKIL